jgi:hypothetical protein
MCVICSHPEFLEDLVVDCNIKPPASHLLDFRQQGFSVVKKNGTRINADDADKIKNQRLSALICVLFHLEVGLLKNRVSGNGGGVNAPVKKIGRPCGPDFQP